VACENLVYVLARLSTKSAFSAVIEAFAADPKVTSGKMMASVGLKVNGKIFAMCWQDKLVVKLPRERVDELVQAKKGVAFDPGHGRKMKEWIAVEGTTPSWISLAREAYRFVSAG
jgi:TfoX/Sxy family transcriptional regulator of competence genes